MRLLGGTLAVVALAMVAAAPSSAHPTRTSSSELAGVPLGTAGGAFLTQLLYETHGDWADAWATLDPFYRKLTNRADFIRCEAASGTVAPVQRIRIASVQPMLFRGPGMSRAIPVAAVTVSVELPWYGPRDPIHASYTFHMVPVRGRWDWILPAGLYRLFSSDSCSRAPAA